jgi:hypothetical protein
MDASYGNNSKLRQDLTGLGTSYVAAIQSTTKVRPVREDDDPEPPRVSVEKLIGGPISGFILEGLGDSRGLGGWRWLFIIEGVQASRRLMGFEASHG